MSVRVDTDKIKKAIIFILPCLLFFWVGDKICCAYRTVSVVGNISVKAMPFYKSRQRFDKSSSLSSSA